MELVLHALYKTISTVWDRNFYCLDLIIESFVYLVWNDLTDLIGFNGIFELIKS